MREFSRRAGETLFGARIVWTGWRTPQSGPNQSHHWNPCVQRNLQGIQQTDHGSPSTQPL